MPAGMVAVLILRVDAGVALDGVEASHESVALVEVAGASQESVVVTGATAGASQESVVVVGSIEVSFDSVVMSFASVAASVLGGNESFTVVGVVVVVDVGTALAAASEGALFVAAAMPAHDMVLPVVPFEVSFFSTAFDPLKAG